MRTTQYARFFDRKVNRMSKSLKKSKHNISARRTYWRRKLRRMGVPEIDLEETVSGILGYRMKRRYHDRNPETARKASRKWNSKHREYHSEYTKRWYANKRLAQRRKLLLAIGG